MAQDAGGGIVRAELAKQREERAFLRPSAGVGRMALRIQSPLIADADAVVVPAPGMRPDPVDRPTAVQLAVTGDVEMIADVREATGQVGGTQGLHREVPVATGGAAMNHQEAHLPVVLIETIALVRHKPQALIPNAPAMAVATAIITLSTMLQVDRFIFL